MENICEKVLLPPKNARTAPMRKGNAVSSRGPYNTMFARVLKRSPLKAGQAEQTRRKDAKCLPQDVVPPKPVATQSRLHPLMRECESFGASL